MSFCTLGYILLRLSLCDPAIAETQLVLGDSLIAFESEWTSVVADRAPLRVTNAVPGYGLNELDYWVARIDEIRERVPQADKILVSLGTNDASLGAVPADYAQRIDTFMGALDRDYPGAPVYWFLASQTLPDDWFPPLAVYVVNHELAAAQARWPNLHVVRTTDLLDGHPERLQSDGIHLSADGARAFLEQVP